MAYRVGYQCFITSEAAHDYLLSQQPPTITEQGELIRPIKKGNAWYLNESQIQLSFPECNIAEQIAFGGLFSGVLIFLALLVFGFRQLRKLIENVGIND